MVENASTTREELAHLLEIKNSCKSRKPEKEATLQRSRKAREFGARLLVPPKTVSAKLSGLRKLFCDEGQRKAREADVLIINHHLFLADMELNDQDFVDFLPDFDMVIFDEAHQLPSIATSFFSESISMSEVKNFAQDAYVTAARLVPKGDEWKDYQTKIFNRCNDVRLKATILGAEEESKEVFG